MTEKDTLGRQANPNHPVGIRVIHPQTVALSNHGHIEIHPWDVDDCAPNQQAFVAQDSAVTEEDKINRMLSQQDSILANQETMLANQCRMIANQAKIIANQEQQIITNQQEILTECKATRDLAGATPQRIDKADARGRPLTVPQDLDAVIHQQDRYAEAFLTRSLKIWKRREHALATRVRHIGQDECTEERIEQLRSHALKLRQLADEACQRAEDAEQAYGYVCQVLDERQQRASPEKASL